MTTAKCHYDFHPMQMVVIAFMNASLTVILYILVAYLATSNDCNIQSSNYFFSPGQGSFHLYILPVDQLNALF